MIVEKVEVLNCRKYRKCFYKLDKDMTKELINPLLEFGLLTIQELSKFNKAFLDTFKISVENALTIEGTIGGNEIIITIIKKEIKVDDTLTSFENILNEM